MKEKKRKPDILDLIYDENNTTPLPVTLKGGRKAYFEQIAVVPRAEETYCLLCPLAKGKSLDVDKRGRPFFVKKEGDGDEGYVFRVVEGKKPKLVAETDLKKIKEVFRVYQELLEEEEDDEDDDDE